eukprot:scaffold12730_cov40-Isochrysis_galbana.AAC.1
MCWSGPSPKRKTRPRGQTSPAEIEPFPRSLRPKSTPTHRQKNTATIELTPPSPHRQKNTATIELTPPSPHRQKYNCAHVDLSQRSGGEALASVEQLDLCKYK